MTRPTAVIFDVDGTLTDVTSIRHHVDPTHPGWTGRKDFDAFHAGSIDCPPHQWVVDLVEEKRAEGHAILVVTARRHQWRYHTLFWLKENEVKHDALFMRADDDHRRDFEVKADVLAEIRRRWDVVLAVDDNPSVIELWQSEGIPVVVVPGWGEAPPT